MILYRGMDRAALDAAYDNSAAVADSPAIIADWNARSDRLASERPQHLDLRYGQAERNRIDYFAGAAGAPVLIFIHGGYWQMRAKETFRFLAAGPLAHGLHVAFIAYTLAPGKTLEGICAEVRAAVSWLAGRVAGLGGDPARICISGWSAGGHLTAMCLDEPAVSGGLAISGIYDLEPIRLCYLNQKLGLDEETARRLSPLLNLPPRSKPLIIAYGTRELPELRRQSAEFGAARQRAGLPGRVMPLSGRNHFTILEDLARPDGALTMLVCELAGD
jgi:acetyl esterase/lipase